MRYGIDVSHCQGYIDWSKLDKDIKFAILRTGYSYGVSYHDKQFTNNVHGCQAAGIEIYGVYHFSYATSVAEAKLEAKECINRLTTAKLPSTTRVFFDFEYGGEEFCKKNGVTPNTDFVRAITSAFCDEIRSAGYTPGVYLNVDYYDRMYKHVLPGGVVVWAAKWVNMKGNTVVPEFDTKTLTDTAIQPPFKFDIWQYGGREIPGIGLVDANVIFDDESVKMESPKKSNEEIAKEVIRGDWGNGAERMRRLEEAGYNYRAVQDIVNRMIT